MDSNKPHHLMMAALLYEVQPPRINKSELTDVLRTSCGTVHPFGEADNLFFAFPDHMVTFSDGKSIPAQAVILDSPDAFEVRPIPESALQQAWDWPEARQVTSRCPGRVMVSEMMTTTLARRQRLALFHGVVESVVKVAPCQAVYWMSSDQLLNPAAYLRRQHTDGSLPLYAAVNVRLFNIQGRGPGELLMDSIGMSVFGLPDVQCHFAGLDPNDIAALLYSAAQYMFDAGDVIQDGHTIDGIRPGQKWKCQHELSLLEPKRAVLDINPGPSYAAGNQGDSPAVH